MLTHFFTSILSTADRAIPATFLAAPPIQAYTRIWILNNAENIISKCIFPYCDGGESYEWKTHSDFCGLGNIALSVGKYVCKELLELQNCKFKKWTLCLLWSRF